MVGEVHRWVGLVAVLSAACDAGDPSLAGDQLAIVGGTISPSDHATVALMHAGEPFCSGVVIEPTLVLTAAHCLPPHVEQPLAEIEVFFGADVSQGGDLIAIADGRAHPLWREGSAVSDIGLITLAEPAPAAPATLAASVDEVVLDGDTVRAVGFGVAAAGAPIDGLRRAGPLTVTELAPSSIHLAAATSVTCSGDSGGPLFASSPVGDVVVGVHSRSNCTDEALAERVDAHLGGFLSDYIAGTEPAEPQGCPEADHCDTEGTTAGCAVAGSGGHSAAALLIVAMLGILRRCWSRVSP